MLKVVRALPFIHLRSGSQLRSKPKFYPSLTLSRSLRDFATMAQLDLTIPNLKLNDGTSIPMLGYGIGTAWFKTGEESKIDQAAIDAIKLAIQLGFTHIDCAESMDPLVPFCIVYM